MALTIAKPLFRNANVVQGQGQQTNTHFVKAKNNISREYIFEHRNFPRKYILKQNADADATAVTIVTVWYVLMSHCHFNHYYCHLIEAMCLAKRLNTVLLGRTRCTQSLKCSLVWEYLWNKRRIFFRASLFDRLCAEYPVSWTSLDFRCLWKRWSTRPIPFESKPQHNGQITSPVCLALLTLLFVFLCLFLRNLWWHSLSLFVLFWKRRVNE